MNSASTKSRAQLIFHHRSLIVAEQKTFQNSLGHWLGGSPSQESPPNAFTFPVWLRAETSNTSFVAPDCSSREAKINGLFPLQFERTCTEEVELEAGFDLIMPVAYAETYSAKGILKFCSLACSKSHSAATELSLGKYCLLKWAFLGFPAVARWT